ncbi:MAG: 4a-hydroxytetrahydrobiopterin dehydratase [Nocardioidaceae bacterium]
MHVLPYRSFVAGARLVHAISELADRNAHHPDVDLRYAGVTVRLLTLTPDYCGLSRRDVGLARQISAPRVSLASWPTHRSCRPSRSRSTRSCDPT